MAKHHIYLVPGFFGFSNIGGITYFHHVREFLEEAFREVGQVAKVVGVATLPTGSIPRRAAKLLECIDAHVDDDGPIYLIGHSTGGLDTRMLVSPGVALPSRIDPEEYARRVRAVVTIATPHLGTPMASVFNSLFGQQLLGLLTLATIYTLRFGQLPMRALIEIMGIMTHLDRMLGLEDTLREQFYGELFREFDHDKQATIHEFLELIRGDRAVIGQLTPGAMDVFNAGLKDREGLRYGCVITRAATLSLKNLVALKLDPYAHVSHVVFRSLQLLTARNGHYFDLHPSQELQFVRAYGDLPGSHSSDGVVPTLSQLWGDIVHVCRADHLDVCGHFRDPGHQPPHVDWFVSGSGFRREQFDALWEDVARFLMQA